MKISWSNQSLNDLDGIYEYIAKDSKFYAQRTVEKIIEKAKHILMFPESGKMVPEYNDKSIRQLLDGNYRIIYKISVNKIMVVTVVHGARNLK